MESTETGKDKVRKICEVLRHETLEPAMKEAANRIEEAEKSAEEILRKAREQASSMIQEAEKDIDQKYNIFKASLNQGARQSIEWLKQEIEERVLTDGLESLIVAQTSKEDVIAKMVEAVIEAVKNEGLDTDLSVVIPSAVNAEDVNKSVGKELIERLKENGVVVGPQKGGITLKLHGQNVIIDLSDKALLDLMLSFVRKSFHHTFFAN